MFIIFAWFFHVRFESNRAKKLKHFNFNLWLTRLLFHDRFLSGPTLNRKNCFFISNFLLFICDIAFTKIKTKISLADREKAKGFMAQSHFAILSIVNMKEIFYYYYFLIIR